MRKSHRPTSDTRSDSNDQATRLYRGISDVARHLDDQRSRAESVRELFGQNIELQRVKLRDYCDRLMFMDPVNFGRKAEEILWRKGFYEVVATVKRLNKAGTVDVLDLSLVLLHLQTGIGHYHHLVMKIQTHYKLDLRGIADFPLLITDHGLKKESWWTVKPIESGALEWAHQAIHRCLVYLGDLSRYITDFDQSHDNSLATRYYAQALNWKPESGVPHNQLGTLATGQNYGLDTTYHYMRSICCIQKFEGTEGNLQHLMDSNARSLDDICRSKDQPSSVQKLVVGFMYITYSLFCDRPCPQFNQLCNEIMAALNACLSEIEPSSKNNTDAPKLTDEMIFKMVVISIMCIERLKAKGSSMTVGGMALILALISQVIRCAVARIETAIPPRPPPNMTNGDRPRRRRRRRRNMEEASSDLSEEDTESNCTGDSDSSEEDLIFDQLHNSDDEFHQNGNGLENNLVVVGGENGFGNHYDTDNSSSLSSEKNGSLQAWHHPIVLENKTFQHIYKISQEGYIMQTIKVCCDWLSDNVSLIKSCGPSCALLISRLVALLNHLSVVPNYKTMKDHLEPDAIAEEVLYCISLPEDIRVRGLAGLQSTQAGLDWNFLRLKTLESKQETYARISKLVRFGVQLADSGEVDLNYIESNQWFSCEVLQSTSPKESQTDCASEKERLMQEMGQLWLKAEVNKLETKTRKTTPLPPYIVVDTEAFIYHPSLVKQLTAAKKFILVIPDVVVSALDEQKRCSGRVRDTIRWLESQFRNGNRFFRAQRPNEHQTLPLIKYPKKKDKEALMFFQIVECCHYLSQQSTGDKNSELVTFVTGSKTLMTNNHSSGFSPLGVAKSAGVNVEHIETFFSKWKSSSKSHG